MLCIREQILNSFGSTAPRRFSPRFLPSRPRRAEVATKASLRSNPNKAGNRWTGKPSMPTAVHPRESHSGLYFGHRAIHDLRRSKRETGCSPRPKTPAGSANRGEEHSSILAAANPPAAAPATPQTASSSPTQPKPLSKTRAAGSRGNPAAQDNAPRTKTMSPGQSSTPAPSTAPFRTPSSAILYRPATGNAAAPVPSGTTARRVPAFAHPEKRPEARQCFPTTAVAENENAVRAPAAPAARQDKAPPSEADSRGARWAAPTSSAAAARRL